MSIFKIPKTLPALFLLSFLGLVSVALSQEDQLVIHEWGTITSHHYANGQVAGYLNQITDDEILPDFVHRLDTNFVEVRPMMKSSFPGGGHASVTMRLETPVIYFYPAQTFDLSKPIDVDVEFRGGLLNEFYPDAQATYQGNIATKQMGFDLNEETHGILSWKGITLGGPWPGPVTSNPVWLSPRTVKSSDVRTAKGESERYLFYRGVAHLDSLLRTEHDLETKALKIYNPADLTLVKEGHLTVPSVWVVDVKEDGTAAFEQLGTFILSDNQEEPLAVSTFAFPKDDYGDGTLDLLRQSIRKELVKAGLFPEEADAMLNTWDKQYFRNPGTRVLFIVPKKWIDHYLPLRFSVPAKVERVLIGRIDLLM